jgi:hypothetical protein
MTHKKGCEMFDNVGKRPGIYGNFLDERSPLLLFRRIAGEGGCQPIGTFSGDVCLSPRKGRGNGSR